MRIRLWNKNATSKDILISAHAQKTKSKKEKSINRSIRLDDNINIFKKKIFVYLSSAKIIDVQDENMIYMWIERQIQPTPVLIMNFITHVFRKEIRITKDYFQQCAKCYFGEELELNGSFAYIDKGDALNIINSNNKRIIKVIEPVLFKYTISTFFDMSVNYDPRSKALKTNNVHNVHNVQTRQ